MVWIRGGEFSMGAAVNGAGSSEMPMASNDSEPVHRVRVDGFWMDATPVTNEQFEKFVKATGYVTIAERKPTKEEFPTAPEENLVAGSVVFAGRKATSRERKNIPSSRLLIQMRRPTQNGRGNVCQPRRSLNLRRVVAYLEKSMYGAMSFAPVENGWPTHGRENFPSKMRAKTVMPASHR
jgi:hypothetical protein